jgi:tetratricopeptide (TPR) repeat protein
MKRVAIVAHCLLLAGMFCWAQAPSNTNSSGKNSAPQDSASRPADHDDDTQESSSSETRTDISPPKDDEKNHPHSKSAVADLTAKPPSDDSDIQEFHPFNPMKASKDIEVGDFYFRRKNFRAALDRYKEALYYKDNDAIAMYRLAVCYEKTGDKTEARKYFEQYLKILPEGPMAKDAHASIDKLAKSQ